jgi:replicative DNA helicase
MSAADIADDELGVVAGLLDILQEDPKAVRDIVATLPVEAFTTASGDVYAAIKAEIDTENTPTKKGVWFRLQQHGHDLQSPAGQRLVDALEDKYTAGASPYTVASLTRQSADRVRGLHEKRLLVEAANRVSASGGSPEDIADFARLLERAKTTATRRTSTLTDYLDQWARRERPPRVPTGFDWFDEPTEGGLPIGGIVSLFAPPKSAKSALAFQLVVGAMLQNPNLRVVWARGEMTAEDFANRGLALGSGLVEGCEPVTMHQSATRHPKARRATLKIAEAFTDRITFLDPQLTVPKIAAAVQETGAGVVVIDYIQKLVLPDGGRDPVRDLDTIVGDVRDLTERANLATIMVSSMAKPTSGTGGHLGQLGRGTVEIGHVCELGYEAVIRNRDAEGNPVRDADGCFDIRWRCAGARNLEQLDLVLRFHGASQTYADATPAEEPWRSAAFRPAPDAALAPFAPEVVR